MGLTAQAGPECVTLDGGIDAIKGLSSTLATSLSVAVVDQETLDGLKFSAALPLEMAIHVLSTRGEDPPAARLVCEMPLDIVNEKSKPTDT